MVSVEHPSDFTESRSHLRLGKYDGATSRNKGGSSEGVAVTVEFECGILFQNFAIACNEIDRPYPSEARIVHHHISCELDLHNEVPGNHEPMCYRRPGQ